MANPNSLLILLATLVAAAFLALLVLRHLRKRRNPRDSISPMERARIDRDFLRWERERRGSVNRYANRGRL